MVGRGEEGGGSGGGGKGRGVGGKGTPRLIIELTPAACPPCLPPVLPIARCRSYDSSNHERFPVGDTSKRAFTYFVMTGGRFVGAAAVRLAVLKFLLSMTATKDVLAMKKKPPHAPFGGSPPFSAAVVWAMRHCSLCWAWTGTPTTQAGCGSPVTVSNAMPGSIASVVPMPDTTSNTSTHRKP